MGLDLSQLLMLTAKGEEAAIANLLAIFSEQKWSSEEQQMITLYLSQLSQKNAHALYVYALLHEHGFGVKKDPTMAFLLMRQAAGKGHAIAIYEIGRYFFEGIGVEKNYASAFQWFELAAVSPHYVPAAMLALQIMYGQGLGVEANPTMAVRWQLAAEEILNRKKR